MKLACVQADVVFANAAANAARAVEEIKRLKGEGVDLVVFPEAFLTGYCVDCIDDAQQIALSVTCGGDNCVTGAPDPVLAIQRVCLEQKMHAVVGFAGNNGNHLYNGAILFDPEGNMRRYMKTHLPELGLDKYVVRGDELPVFDTELGRIGILICFDLRAPEAARVLALEGAELIVLPTNWPEGAEVSAEHISIARAAENRVFLATCNRAGEEHGFKFIGRSRIISPVGKVLAEAGSGEETIVAEIDLQEARQKRTVNIAGKYETEVFASRRPELYGRLSGLS
jgi:5-aminopentanamidase